MVDISFLIDRLAPLIEKKVKEEYDLFVNSKTEALNLSSSLKDIQKVLEEAEKRRLTDPRVKGWIERLQDVTYDIDDVLDELAQIEGHYKAATDEYQKPCMEKVCIPIRCPCFNVKRFHRRRQIALDIRDLNAKVDLLDKETVKYSLLPVISDTQDSQLDISTPYTELFNLVPQKCQVTNLVIKLSYSGEQAHKKLVILPGQVNEIQVYSLVGLAGVGKTTIAQLVFHDTKVKDTFSIRLWACVSNCLDGFGVCKAILDALKIWLPPNTSSDFQTLLHYIESSISGEKFFLVLDDVRIEDDSMWKELKACFRYGEPGSRILVTTRNKKVAKVIGHASKIESVDPLTDYHCGLLLKWFTFQGRKKKDFRELKSIASSLGKKCKGMPLAAKTLGIYLNSTDSEHLWREALTKELWQFDEMSKTIFAPLASSYKDLPLVLKHCLSYSATFLPSCEIEVNELIRLWSVHGYFDFGGTKGDVDTRGQEYVEKLTEHSFFQKCISDHSKQFARIYMHDIVHDFAQYLLINESKAKQLRHINCEELKTEQHDDLKYARLMILKCCFELPVKIRSMIHLRYLDLKGTAIVQLPASICNLFNLQTLDLQNCENLSGLPEKIHKLRNNLRFLLLEGTTSLKRLPKGIKRLTSIQTLDQFVVGKDCSKLRYLKKLNKLQGSLRVSFWAALTERDIATAGKAKLKDKIKLSDLTFFIWADVPVEVMEALEPPSNLLSLCMDGYGASELPRWFSTSLHSIKKLEIKSCNGLSHLPPLGKLHSLEELKISRMDSLTFVGPEFVGPFSTYGAGCSGFLKLKTLTFVLCPLLQEWKDINDQEERTLLSIMPLLDSLTVSYCATLERLPNRLLRRTTCRRRLISWCPLLSEMSA